MQHLTRIYTVGHLYPRKLRHIKRQLRAMMGYPYTTRFKPPSITVIPITVQFSRVFCGKSNSTIQSFKSNKLRNSLCIKHWCWVKILADDILKYLSSFSPKIGFDISCKLSTYETICMKCRILLSEKTIINLSSDKLPIVWYLRLNIWGVLNSQVN